MTGRVPELAALRLLVGVARLGSIGAASRAQGITQQAASERLRAVETQTGLTLLRRGARGSHLTEAGAVVVEWAARLIDLADEIDHAIEGLRADDRRDLAVWSSMTIAESLLPRWLVMLRQRQVAEGGTPTAVSLRAVNSNEVVAAVRDGRAGLGFVEGADAPIGMRSRVVSRDELVLVALAGTPLSRRRTPLSPREISVLPLTGREPGSGTREVVAAALGRHGLTASEPLVELTTATAIREAVIAGSAPAFLSRRVAAREIESGQLVVLPTPALTLTRSFRAVWSGGREPPAGPVRELVEIARSTSAAT